MLNHRKDHLWLYSSCVGLGVFYLNLIWKTTGSGDRLTTDFLFLLAIFGILWQKRLKFKYDSNLWSSLLGISAIFLILTKTISLFWFEANLLSLVPFCGAISLALIASGFKGIWQYKVELFLIWFLFFPEGVIGHFIDNLINLTVLTASCATYLLYYFGFNVVHQGNTIILISANLGKFKAVVDYPCAGVPMILLMLKLSLLFINLFAVKTIQRVTIPVIAATIGFVLGTIRVCLLTLLISNPEKFSYWHGAGGSQIFSTLGIIIFSGYSYWIWLQISNPLVSTNNVYSSTSNGEAKY